MIIRLSDDAERDLLDGIAFYDQHGRDIGTQFFDGLMDDLRSLSVVGGVHAKRYGYHCLASKRFPFAICDLRSITLSTVMKYWLLEFLMSVVIRNGLLGV